MSVRLIMYARPATAPTASGFTLGQIGGTMDTLARRSLRVHRTVRFQKQTARLAIWTIGSSGRLRESTPQERSELLSRNHRESERCSHRERRNETATN